VIAKSAATLQHLSGDRLMMSLAAGYLRAEFEALGADMSTRNEVVDEGIEAMKAAWSGKPFMLRSPRWKVDGNSALPAADPAPVLWSAGNSRVSVARAAQSCDGWAPFEVDAIGAQTTATAALADGAALSGRITLYRRLCEEAGRPDAFQVFLTRSNWTAMTARPPSQVRDELAELREAGVSWIGVTPLASGPDEWLRGLEALQQIAN
jgi:alkanesulfonate monooxygenase SsuD/methylene tetrahydromethanopterin reductase-like flavin-dependent oxidoreductase (luciferase family)